MTIHSMSFVIIEILISRHTDRFEVLFPCKSCTNFDRIDVLFYRQAILNGKLIYSCTPAWDSFRRRQEFVLFICWSNQIDTEEESREIEQLGINVFTHVMISTEEIALVRGRNWMPSRFLNSFNSLWIWSISSTGIVKCRNSGVSTYRMIIVWRFLSASARGILSVLEWSVNERILDTCWSKSIRQSILLRLYRV